MRWFDPAGWVKLAEHHRAQGSALVPSMIQMLLGQPLEEADLSELTSVSSGAAPLPEEVRREFERRVPSATIYEGYGCTEAATFISANPAGVSWIRFASASTSLWWVKRFGAFWI